MKWRVSTRNFQSDDAPNLSFRDFAKVVGHNRFFASRLVEALRQLKVSTVKRKFAAVNRYLSKGNKEVTETLGAREYFTELTKQRGILYGGDYNPDQWTREVWEQDIAAMKEAGVNLVSVGIFSWSQLEPQPGQYNFGWFDEILGLLHEADIAVDLATPTASPPPWMGLNWPESLAKDPNGVVMNAGSRNHFSPSSQVYQDRCRSIVQAIVERYHNHPAVVMWHIGNEYGQVDYSDDAAAAFRIWLRQRYGSIDELNAAWGTAFWSQRYDHFGEILPPRSAPYIINPTQNLDFHRFSSDQMLECYRQQYDLIRQFDPVRPITTNFMGFHWSTDYQQWAEHMDVVSDDYYNDPTDDSHRELATLTHSLIRSLGNGQPWVLMEQAVSAVNWRAHNVPKTPASSRIDSLRAIAHGADASLYFQWRSSRFGGERFHSALIPHAGTDTEQFRGVARHGQELKNLAPVAGSTSSRRVALVFSWPSMWASSERALPTNQMPVIERLRAYHRPFFDRNIQLDVVGPKADLAGYDLVILPQQFLLSDDDAAALRAYVATGRTVVIGAFSGIVDENGHVYQGRFPVPLVDLTGVSGEDWIPLPEEGLKADGDLGQFTTKVWAERLRTEGAEVLSHLVDDGSSLGRTLGQYPAITKNSYEQGTVYYVGLTPPDEVLEELLTRIIAETGVAADLPSGLTVPLGVEAVRRGAHIFVLNPQLTAQQITVPAGSVDLLSGAEISQNYSLAPQEAIVITERS